MERFDGSKGTERKENDSERNVETVDRGTMRERLLGVNNESEYQEYIYPYFEQIAGKTLPPLAVAGVITLAIDRYTLGDRSNPSSQLLRMFIPHFVDAIVDDPAAQQMVKDALKDR